MSVSHVTTTKLVTSLGDGFDEEVNKWKNALVARMEQEQMVCIPLH